MGTGSTCSEVLTPGSRKVSDVRVENAPQLTPRDAGWPTSLARLGAEVPEALMLFGNLDLLTSPSLGFFCSVRAPGRIIVESFDVATGLAGSGGTVIGGFQSPLERELLRCLLRGSAAAIVCAARSVEGMTIPGLWRPALDEGRLLLLSAFSAPRRPTSILAERRNLVAAALSTRVLILHASAGGRLARLALQCSTWGLALHCFDHPANEDLRLLGATPFRMVPAQPLPPIERPPIG